MRALAWAALLGACAADPCPGATLEPLASPPTYAVVSSDYSSTAIALLDEEGALLEEAWVDSGTVRPGIVAALSGDVSLPLAPFAPCTMVLIDRFSTDVLTFLDTCGGAPLRFQVHVAETFSANPRDVLRVGGRAWVSRYGVDRAAEPGDPDRGDDIAILDGDRLVSHVDLSAGDAGDDVFARPDRMVLLRAGETARVVVGLARLSSSFMTSAPGAVAVVDPETLEVRIHPLGGGLTFCGELDAVGDVVVVTCAGPTFTVEEEARREGSGIVALALSVDGTLREVAAHRASEHPDEPVPSGPTVPLAADRWVSVAWGVYGGDVPDRVRFYGREPGPLFRAPAFTVGDGVYDAERDLLLLPDADAVVVRRFRASGEELESVPTAGCRGLPPREVRRVAAP